MKTLALSLTVLASTLGLTGCGDRSASDTRADPRDAEAVAASRALAKNPQEMVRRLHEAEIEAPGTGTRLRLSGGRGSGPGTPPPWNVEIRRIVGVVPSGSGLDVFADLAVHRPLKAPSCYLALFHLDGPATTYTASVPIGEGSRIVEAKERGAKGDSYALEVEYLDRAPLGDFLSSPSVRKRRMIQVVRRAFADAGAATQR